MEITKARLREIITEEIQNMTVEARVPDSPDGPWTDDYAEFDGLAKEAHKVASTSGNSREGFDTWMDSLDDKYVIGAYHRLMSSGGMDPMTGVAQEDPEYVSWRDRPSRNPLSVQIAMYIRSQMTPEQHTLRRVWAEPPAPSHTEVNVQYANQEEYFQAEASEERKQVAAEFGGDEGSVMQKYVYSR